MWKCHLWRKKALTHLCKEFVIENLWRSFNILKDKLCFFWRDPFPFFNSGLISYCCCNVLVERLSQPHHRPWPQSRRHSRLLWDEALPAINMNNCKQSLRQNSKIVNLFQERDGSFIRRKVNQNPRAGDIFQGLPNIWTSKWNFWERFFLST